MSRPKALTLDQAKALTCAQRYQLRKSGMHVPHVSHAAHEPYRALKHGLSQTRAYSVWSKMLRRCENPRHWSWPHYGGRGIKVCDRWHDLCAFVSDMGQPPDGMTLDRIDNDGNYEPGNCRWATRKEQRRNSRQKLIMLEVDGLSRPLIEWAEILGVSKHTLLIRLRRGWPHDAIVRGWR